MDATSTGKGGEVTIHIKHVDLFVQLNCLTLIPKVLELLREDVARTIPKSLKNTLLGTYRINYHTPHVLLPRHDFAIFFVYTSKYLESMELDRIERPH